MNRFQILKRQEATKPQAYQFKQTNSAAKVYGYMKRCIQDEVIFDANNIYPSVVDQALTLLQKERRIPIITKTEKMARTLSLTYALQKVHTVDNIPLGSPIICYWDLNPREIPKDHEIILIIRRKNDDK